MNGKITCTAIPKFLKTKLCRDVVLQCKRKIQTKPLRLMQEC